MKGFIRTRKAKDGKPHYQVIVKIDGRQHSLGTYRLKKDAWAKLSVTEAQWAAGTYGKPEATFDEYYESWLEKKRKKWRPGTYTSYEHSFRNHILPFFGEKNLRAINPAMVNDWVDELCGKNFSPATVRRFYRYLRAFLNSAEAKDYIDKKPCRDIDLPKMPNKEMDFLKPAELKKLLVESPEHERALFALLAYSGLRLGEGLALTWGDITERGINVWRSWDGKQFGDTKTKASCRVVPVMPVLQRVLEELRQNAERTGPRDYLFSHEGDHPWDQSNTRDKFEAALKKAGLRHLTIHSLRHTFASVVLASGVTIKGLQHALGHASAVMTLNVYAHLIQDDAAKEALRRASRAFGEAA